MDANSYGILTIRAEIAVPTQGEGKATKCRLITLATYPEITQAECPAIVERFCNENNIPRMSLFCEWKFAAPVF